MGLGGVQRGGFMTGTKKPADLGGRAGMDGVLGVAQSGAVRVDAVGVMLFGTQVGCHPVSVHCLYKPTADQRNLRAFSQDDPAGVLPGHVPQETLWQSG
jgi:hypothetical protein